MQPIPILIFLLSGLSLSRSINALATFDFNHFSVEFFWHSISLLSLLICRFQFLFQNTQYHPKTQENNYTDQELLYFSKSYWTDIDFENLSFQFKFSFISSKNKSPNNLQSYNKNSNHYHNCVIFSFGCHMFNFTVHTL